MSTQPPPMNTKIQGPFAFLLTSSTSLVWLPGRSIPYLSCPSPSTALSSPMKMIVAKGQHNRKNQSIE